jgi:hypothetical protein
LRWTALQTSKAFRSSGRFLNAVFTFSDNVEVCNFRCNPLGRKTRNWPHSTVRGLNPKTPLT